MHSPYSPPKSNLDLTPPTQEQEKDLSSPFSIKGRFGRLSYIAWNTLLLVVIILLILGMANAEYRSNFNMGGISILIIILGVFIGFIFLIRRLHDTGISGWWLLLSFIPVVNTLFVIYVVVKQGDVGSNTFSPPRTTALWEKIIGGVMAIVLVVFVIITIIR